MIVYFLIFFIALLFTVLANDNFKNENKKLGILFSVLAILVPSILAGLRLKGVGTDTLYYFDAAFMYSQNSDSLLQLFKVSDIEPLYNVVNFIISRFTDNINAVYFVLQLIIMIFAYLTCYDNRKKISLPMSYLIFMLLYYNRSLNMCRQTIAIVIFLYAIKYIKEKKFFKYLLFILIAVGFHKTALFCLPIYLIIDLLNKKDAPLYRILIIISSLVLVIFYKYIMLFIINIFSFIPSRYVYYVSNANNNLILIELILKVVLLGIVLLFSNKMIEKNDDNKILIFLMILDIILYFIGIHAASAQRLSFYIGYLNIFALAQLKDIFTERSKKMVSIIIIAILCCYSYLYYDVAQYDQTVPYYSILK